jgi:hypothetical protein
MKKILLILTIALITKNADAQQNKHVEVILTDSIISYIDTAYWYADYYVDYSLINLDSSILKQKNPRLENTLRRSIADDSAKNVLNMLDLEIRNMKNVLISKDLIFDNSKVYNNIRGHSYITTSYSGIKEFFDYCYSKKINLSLYNVKYNYNENSEILLRNKLLEKSRKIALASLPSFNGKSLELLSITQAQTETETKVNFYSSFEISRMKQLIDDNVIFKVSNRLTLKFDYLIK